VVVYEAFRAPKFVPEFLRGQYEAGLFDYKIPREEFNGTDLEYYQQLPG
jgi:hypothetical protein